MSGSDFILRPYAVADEAAAIALWQRTWQIAYPQIDFTARLAWWCERWRGELVPNTTIAVAERAGEIIGFVTVDPATGYLDQIVVAPEEWGSDLAAALMAEAKRIAPSGLELHVNQDNGRAIRYYAKHGFIVSGADVNPRSGALLHKMTWRP